MNIMVFDVPAANGGALTILNQYYKKATQDKTNNWYFVISTPDLANTENVTILKYPWVKKSWFHRLYFDKNIAYKLIDLYNIDEVLSLQNVVIPKVKVKQILYLHQPLPFVEKRYKITENYRFWLYQNIISKIIYKSIKKADKLIVQTEWMKYACLKKVDTDPNKIIVNQPEINIEVNKNYQQEDNENKLFFYPSSGLVYKNHKVVVETAKKLKEQNITNYRIVFTLNGNENCNVNKLYKIVKEFKLPIDFIGEISIEEVYDYYSKAILIFPSYIETFGLPMLEARMHGTPIIASDCAFSHEILRGYDKVDFFDPFAQRQLYDLMRFMVEK